MTTEQQLANWTGPSSDTEKDKQDRTCRMVEEAVEAHAAFDDCRLSVYPKGSYANQTNVRADSDVDIVVQCHECQYYDEVEPGARPAANSPYTGIWTPAHLRAELVKALKAKFGDQVDTSGSTAIAVNSGSARVDADVVPSFDYRYYFSSGGHRDGTKVFRKDGTGIVNYPAQHLAKGQEKDAASGGNFKKTVRILKRVENLMVEQGVHDEVASYFVECLVYNCPNDVLLRSTWLSTIKGVLVHIWEGLEADEPNNNDERWLEVNRCKYLFSSAQAWTRPEGRAFAKAAWNYLELAS